MSNSDAMQFLGLFAAAALSIPNISAAQNGVATGNTELPAEARKLIERSAACQHFAGEIAGNGSERDRQVNRQIKKLRCDSLAKDANQIRRRHKGQPDVIRLIDESVAWLAT